MSTWEANRDDGGGPRCTARKAVAGEDGGLGGAPLVPGKGLGVDGQLPQASQTAS